MAPPPDEPGASVPTIADPETEEATPLASATGSGDYRFALGLQLGLRSGIAPGLSPGGGVFGEVSRRPGGPGLRLSLSLDYGTGDTRGLPVTAIVYGGRVEVHAWSWRWSALSLAPCVGIDLGLLEASAGEASGGRRDRGAWAAAGGHLRASLEVGESLALELQLGAVAPLVRYSLGAVDGRDLYRIDAVLPHLALGVAMGR